MATHDRDEHCTVDPATDTCIECGVLHGEQCPGCGGRGFHRTLPCPFDGDSDPTTEVLTDA